MKKLHILLLVSFFSYSALADKYAVVSNQNVKELSKTQIKAIFLKKLKMINDIKLIPLNTAPKDKLRVKFEKRILRMSFGSLKAYWNSQHYLGQRPPLSMKSQESVITFVKRVDGAIGYINEKNLDNKLKVLYKWED